MQDGVVPGDVACPQCTAHTHPNAHSYTVVGNLECDRPRTSTAFPARVCANVDASLLLQRDFFHLRVSVDPILLGAGEKCRRLFTALRARKCARSAVARTSVRHDWTEEDDCCHLWSRGNLARFERLAFSRGTADRTNANVRLDGNLFHRLGRGKLSLLDSE